MRYTIIENGRVANVALADAPRAPNWVQSDTAGIGDRYDGGTFTAPPAPVAPPVVRHITRLAFLTRFTDGEAIAIDLASQGATVQAAAMRRYTTKVNASTYIDLDRADTRAGVIALEAAGLLAAGRALVILDAPVLGDERYKG